MKNAADTMRQDWDERARQDAFLYIASWRSDWSEDTFFASGESDFERLVSPTLIRLGVTPATGRIAELGCGAGRMTRTFAQRFHSVVAIDISPEMQSRGRAYLHDFSNIEWILTDGNSLAGVASAHVDFVFSYLVLQHLPSRELVAKTIEEMMRILRPSGYFLFQFNGSSLPTMNWKGRLISGALDYLQTVGLKRFSQFIARRAGIDERMVGRTWRGVSLPSDEIGSMVRAAGAVPLGFDDESTPMAWCYGQKSAEQTT
jgi:SAM-dependent methyltransferase